MVVISEIKIIWLLRFGSDHRQHQDKTHPPHRGKTHCDDHNSNEHLEYLVLLYRKAN